MPSEEAKSSSALEVYGDLSPLGTSVLGTMLEVYGALSPSGTSVLSAVLEVYDNLSPSSTSVFGAANGVKRVESTTAASGA